MIRLNKIHKQYDTQGQMHALLVDCEADGVRCPRCGNDKVFKDQNRGGIGSARSGQRSVNEQDC